MHEVPEGERLDSAATLEAAVAALHLAADQWARRTGPGAPASATLQAELHAAAIAYTRARDQHALAGSLGVQL